MSGGEYRRHCDHLRNRLAEAKPAVLEEMAKWGVTVDHVPEAGLFLWASLGEGVSSMQTADRMLELGHLIAPSNAFLSGLQDTKNIRINIAEAFEAPLPTLGKLLGRTRQT